jgi:hypothetical protein
MEAPAKTTGALAERVERLGKRHEGADRGTQDLMREAIDRGLAGYEANATLQHRRPAAGRPRPTAER